MNLQKSINKTRTPKSRDRKNQILECAKVIFARKGFYETQIIDIVNELNIGKGTPYQYFENKEELFLSLIESIYQSWRDFRRNRASSTALAAPADYFRREFTGIMHFFHNDPDSAKILLRMGPGINRSIEPFVSRIEQHFIDEIKSGIKKGIEFDVIEKDCNIELLTNVIFGTATRIAYYYIARNNEAVTKRKLDGIIGETTEMLIKIIYKKEYW